MTLYYLVEFVDDNNAIGITRSEWVRPSGCTDFPPGSITFTNWPAKDYLSAITAKEAFSVRFHKKVFLARIERASGSSSVLYYTFIYLQRTLMLCDAK